MFDYLILLPAFVFGFSLSRASTCTVAATRRLVRRGKPDWLIGIGVAVCTATACLLLLRFGLGVDVPNAHILPIGLVLVAAAIIMGVGAYLNDGCFIGSVGRLTSGDPSFLTTFLGLIAARHIVNQWQRDPSELLEFPISALMAEGTFFWVSALIGTFGAVYGVVRFARKREPAILALCIMGIAAVLTFALNPEWSYEAWIGRMLAGQGLSNGLQIELAILALFSGATISAILNFKFTPRWPRLKRALLCFVGGILMGLGAIFTAGGNDTLLLWTIPNFVLHGLVVYAVMVATVASLILITGERKRDV